MTAAKKPPIRPSLFKRTPAAEWTAAALGLVLTLGVLGYSVWEGVRAQDEPPELQVQAERTTRTDGGWLVEVQVRNGARATAAGVQVRGALRADGATIEESGVTFDYVPGEGSARGGLLFQSDPRTYDLSLRAEGYTTP